MGLFLEGLANYWREIVIVALIVAAGLYITALRTNIALDEAKITTLKANITTLTENNAVLTQAIRNQNGAIDKISDLSDVTRKGFESLGSTVTQQTSNLNNALTNLASKKKPVTCDDTIKYLIDAKKGYVQ